MRIRIDQPELLPDLVATLTARIDLIASPVSERELEVSLLGSIRQPYLQLELEQRLRPWRLRHPETRVEIGET